MNAAKLVLKWYEENRDNEDYPFIIPQPALKALVVAIRTAIENNQAERDAEQLAAPVEEEES